MMWMWRFFWVWVAISCGVVLATKVFAHSFYDYDCCHQRDCGPVPSTQFRPTPSGWQWIPNGEIIPYDSHKIRKSPDGSFHRCGQNSPLDPEKARCFYIPEMGT